MTPAIRSDKATSQQRISSQLLVNSYTIEYNSQKRKKTRRKNSQRFIRCQLSQAPQHHNSSILFFFFRISSFSPPLLQTNVSPIQIRNTMRHVSFPDKIFACASLLDALCRYAMYNFLTGLFRSILFCSKICRWRVECLVVYTNTEAPLHNLPLRISFSNIFTPQTS